MKQPYMDIDVKVTPDFKGEVNVSEWDYGKYDGGPWISIEVRTTNNRGGSRTDWVRLPSPIMALVADAIQRCLEYQQRPSRIRMLAEIDAENKAAKRKRRAKR